MRLRSKDRKYTVKKQTVQLDVISVILFQFS
jgi:hypothetical protein